MFCIKCGQQLLDDAKFCFKCGGKTLKEFGKKQSEPEAEKDIKTTEQNKKENNLQNQVNRPSDSEVLQSPLINKIKPKKKLLISLAVIVGAILSVVVIFSLISIGNKVEKNSKESLARIFVPDMLYADLAYFEQVTGPARNTDGNTKVYSVDGCMVTATVGGGKIINLKVELSPECTFDLNKILHNARGKLPPPYLMTFGQFEDVFSARGQFMADCLGGCGNAYIPAVHLYWEGSRADSNIEVMLEVEQVDDTAIDAAAAWRDAMVKGESEDWVDNTKFNCSRTEYDEIAHNLFKDVRITAITVGYGIKTPPCN